MMSFHTVCCWNQGACLWTQLDADMRVLYVQCLCTLRQRSSRFSPAGCQKHTFLRSDGEDFGTVAVVLQWEDVVLALLVYQQRGFFSFIMQSCACGVDAQHQVRVAACESIRRQQDRLANGGTAAARHLLQRPAVCQLALLSPRDVTVSTPSLTCVHEFSQGERRSRSLLQHYTFPHTFLLLLSSFLSPQIQWRWCHCSCFSCLSADPLSSCPIIIFLCSLSLPLKVIFAL